MARPIKDTDGKIVEDGDRISFSFGIPPVKAFASIKDNGGTLYAHVDPPVTPSVRSLRYLKRCVGVIYKEADHLTEKAEGDG